MRPKPQRPATGVNGLAAGGSRIRLAVAAVLAGTALPSCLTKLCRHHPCRGLAFGESGDSRGNRRRARKVAENLQEVPVSIDVFTQKDMENLGIASMDDYLQKVPSISYISTGPGTQLFVMRGVSDGSNPNYANTASTQASSSMIYR